MLNYQRVSSERHHVRINQASWISDKNHIQDARYPKTSLMVKKCEKPSGPYWSNLHPLNNSPIRILEIMLLAMLPQQNI